MIGFTSVLIVPERPRRCVRHIRVAHHRYGPGHWITRFSKPARPRILAKLVEDGVLTVVKDRVGADAARRTIEEIQAAVMVATTAATAGSSA